MPAAMLALRKNEPQARNRLMRAWAQGTRTGTQQRRVTRASEHLPLADSTAIED